MIPFDFEYYKPETLDEAINLFNRLESDGKKPIYYGGGTEFISMARMNNRYTEAVVDIKAIPECNIYKIIKNELVLGSAITLTQIAEENLFPLLSMTVQRIADHTIQGKITLGGNLLGTIIYKEALLPLLLSNSEILLANKDGKKRVSLDSICNKGIQLEKGTMIVQVIINKKFLSMPYLHMKRTKNEKIDYPLLTIAALKDNDKISIAFSGLCEYPIRSTQIEDILNDNSYSIDNRINKIIQNLPYELLNDISGSSEYRKFVLKGTLLEVFEKFGEVV
ncbi:FAD binding domain-containing protein [Tissierella sp.]|uniref:FAD binding domain-containing protein n=1 Tax=Tissierella sp. TaxID=41274 RepID=UPI00286567AB|nr:FAD binding domain-containing protein [Tissierella sp.]MDR7857164.1 FAD binding domain-containing protein [Tissierella sp.]